VNGIIDRGEIGAILGSSGSGKSTLMDILGGIDRCDYDKVAVDGIDVAGLKDDLPTLPLINLTNIQLFPIIYKLGSSTV